MQTNFRFRVLFSLAIIIIASCSGSDNDNDPAEQNLIDSRASIIGSWTFVYTETQCEEQYEFSADGSFSQTSLDEILAGSYSLSAVENDLINLTLQPTQDNLGTDCLGSNEDSTIRDFNFILSFPNESQMGWSRTSDPDLVIVTLDRRI